MKKLLSALAFFLVLIWPIAVFGQGYNNYPKGAVLTVSSFPSGATVTVDGVTMHDRDDDSLAVTPVHFDLSLGQHTISVGLADPGWAPYTSKITISKKDNDLTVTLLPVLTTGPQGPAGPVGPTGVAGPQGPAGPSGVGIPGSVGLIGPQGPAGPAGPAGPQGLTGAIGSQGPAGQLGATGPAGNDGAVGPQGPIGPMGLSITGPQGPAGNPGAQGLTGAVGPAGPAGANGIPGVAGSQGIPGVNGNDGAPGPAGPQGPTGNTTQVFMGAWSPSQNYLNGQMVLYCPNGASGTMNLYLNISGQDPPSIPPSQDTTNWYQLTGSGGTAAVTAASANSGSGGGSTASVGSSTSGSAVGPIQWNNNLNGATFYLISANAQSASGGVQSSALGTTKTISSVTVTGSGGGTLAFGLVDITASGYNTDNSTGFWNISSPFIISTGQISGTGAVTLPAASGFVVQPNDQLAIVVVPNAGGVFTGSGLSWTINFSQ